MTNLNSIKLPISIIVPVLNDVTALTELLMELASYQKNGHQVIVIDGGSCDGSYEVACKYADRVICSDAGRATQMNAGAKLASHSLFWFLHADSKLPENANFSILSAHVRCVSASFWGRFDVRLNSGKIIYRVIEFFMNLRSRVTGIATGDQGLFVSRELFNRAGKYPDILLMEDIALSKNLKHYAKPVCLRNKILVSCRRWDEYGPINTIFSMWWLRLQYFFGADPNRLYKIYYSD